jgi:glycosyltransferase involved in cell wall biosynthesis
MHVLNVNSSLDFKTGGGTAERTFQMSRFLAKNNVDCTVLTIDTELGSERIEALKPARVVTLQLLWRRFYVPHFKWKIIWSLVDEADIIHLMGHWSVLNMFVYVAARIAGKPYVICPAGALPIFGRSKLVKRIYNLLIGNAIVRNASGWIAVTQSEFPHFERYGIPASRITIISNGVFEEDFPPVDLASFRQHNKLPDKPMILFMGRLNLIKGPDLLIQAFASVKDRVGDYHLVFAGPDEGMQSSLADIARANGLSERVHFLGFVNGFDKVAAYRLAKLLVVPSRQEAMSIVALEAGICGTPALLTDQCGFGEIKLVHPWLETSADVAGIADGIVQLTMEQGLLEQLGPVFRDFVTQRYAWGRIVEKYLLLYENILMAIPK